MATHWTERSHKDFIFSIASDFVEQIQERMESEGITQAHLAEMLGVSKGRVSQIMNNPGNLTLELVVRCARVLGLKVALFAYNDDDSKNERGTINGRIFASCWETYGRPRTAWDMETIEASASTMEKNGAK